MLDPKQQTRNTKRKVFGEFRAGRARQPLLLLDPEVLALGPAAFPLHIGRAKYKLLDTPVLI